jgi:hypothetical protein
VTQQYLRNISLIVANPAGQGLELGSLRVTFEVHRGDIQTPNSCDIKIYNLSANTANRIKTEFTQLALQVSYGDQALQLIFRGQIKQARQGREDQKNSYVAVTAADADEAYNFSAMALTLAAGATPTDAIQAIIKQMATRVSGDPTGGAGGQQVTQGYLPQLTSSGYTRGRTLYGMCRDEARNIAMSNDCKWSTQDGAFTLIPNAGYIPAAPVLITPYTGLIAVPEQTQNGLEMTVLLNPSIKIGQTVKLDSSDVNLYRYGLDTQSNVLNKMLAQSTTKLNADGLYYVMRAEHSGDTRGLSWYTKIVCLAVNASVPATSQPQAAISPTAASLPRY